MRLRELGGPVNREMDRRARAGEPMYDDHEWDLGEEERDDNGSD